MSAIDISRFARRLLREQYTLVLDAEPGVLAGRIEPLHDMRVAIRRLRNLLKAFRKVLPRPEADALEARFRRLSKKLGPARDMDVWMRSLKSMRTPGSEEWREFVGHQREIQNRKRETLRHILGDPSTHSLKADFDCFLKRADMETADVTLAGLAAKAVRKSLDRVMDRSRLGPSCPARKAHLLRIACRRARYMAEFFTATLGKPAARLARQLKAVQDVLGDIHDCDICLTHLYRAPVLAPSGLVAELNRRRRAHVARFGKIWERLQGSVPPFTCQSPAATAH
jgi:CHAD domain-containing protein